MLLSFGQVFRSGSARPHNATVIRSGTFILRRGGEQNYLISNYGEFELSMKLNEPKNSTSIHAFSSILNNILGIKYTPDTRNLEVFRQYYPFRRLTKICLYE